MKAGEAVRKLVFAMDRIKYKRLWPRYISDMYALKTKYPQTWTELESGNISVTKSDFPFVSIGADHGCEQFNRLMKVQNGLIGISSNANARQRFFLAGPELSRLTDAFKSQFQHKTGEIKEHHDLSPSVVKREHNAIDHIKNAILRHGNPFEVEEDDTLYNLISHAYVPEQYVSQILNIDSIGQKLYEEYVAERINGDVSIWAKVSKEKNNMYMSGNKEQKMRIRDKAVDLKETKDLYGRLMVLARSSRDIDLKQALGNYEFTLTPRALFAPNGSMLECHGKADLIHELEAITEPDVPEPSASTSQHADPAVLQDDRPEIASTSSPQVIDPCPCRRIAVVDGMVVVKKLQKSSTVNTVNDVSTLFNSHVMNMTSAYDEIILVFDTYKPDSLKKTTREKKDSKVKIPSDIKLVTTLTSSTFL